MLLHFQILSHPYICNMINIWNFHFWYECLEVCVCVCVSVCLRVCVCVCECVFVLLTLVGEGGLTLLFRS
jgi:hypothetical protein